MFDPLDGPSAQLKITVTASAVVEVKAGASSLDDRKIVTLQPNGNIKVYFGDGINVPSAATVLANGLDHFKNAKESYEAGYQQKVYIVAASGSVDVVVVERA